MPDDQTFTPSPDRHAARAPDAVDRHVGLRLRARRHQLDLSQESLGEALGVTFQQVQKYERGVNRMGAGRLYQAARTLKVDVSFFFEGLPNPAGVPLVNDDAPPADAITALGRTDPRTFNALLSLAALPTAMRHQLCGAIEACATAAHRKEA